MVTKYAKILAILAFSSTKAQFEAGSEDEDLMEQFVFTGQCPTLKGTMQEKGEKVNLEKIEGLWKVVYESKELTEKMDCMSMKFDRDFEGVNSSTTQVFFGYQIPLPPDSDPDRKHTILYEDGYLNFNDLERINTGKTLVSLEEKEQQDEQDMEDQGEHAQAFQILETDYQNYMLFYSCVENTQHLNQFGQSEAEVDYLKMTNPDQSYDENFTQNKISHQIFARIFSRSLSNLGEGNENLQQWMKKLKEMVGESSSGDYFSNHEIVKHGSTCPPETTDLFTLPESRLYEDFFNEIYGSMDQDMFS